LRVRFTLINEEAFGANAKRMAASPEMMTLQWRTVEHSFGAIKHRILGNACLLLRGLRGARAELRLAVLVYNFLYASNMKGGAGILRA
jgi:transposase